MADGIRTIAIALCRHADRILVERGYDRVSGAHFYRAIGGGVEFGELAAAALLREWREEFRLTLAAPVLRGVLENHFEYEGDARHEIIFVFAAVITEEHAYERDEIEAIDTDGTPHVGVWVPVDVLRTGKLPFYPKGALELFSPAG